MLSPSMMILLFAAVHGYNLDITLIGHRGGHQQLMPELTPGSFSMGAQAGAAYLEPDLVLSKDGQLMVLHDVELSKSTDVASHSEFANRSKTLSGIFWRGDPNNRTDTQPDWYPGDYIENITGWFVHDFTVAELKTLTRRSSAFPDDSPFNGIWSIMTFNESLALTNNLSATLGREIGIIPETKYVEWYRSLGFENIELKVLESLRAYGFVSLDATDGAYEAEISSDGLPMVIVQSFAAESLQRFNALSNDGSVPTMYLLWTTDIDDAEGIERSTLEWILGFSHNVGCSQARVQHLVDARDEMEGLADFEIGVYTLEYNISQYVKWIDMGIDSVFTDDASTGRVTKQFLAELTDDDSELLASFINCDGDESGYAAVSAAMALLCAVISTLFC